ncbi:cytochrome P450 4c3-like [Plodia interpunctella]|uniref:cytochrome P450 4c3-like n=1 Tax=Plodia interpunctella TaxID=58824 RepID=UPI002368528B|nr:cytochrome P450 4c3-like [Plodia interpunctella]
MILWFVLVGLGVWTVVFRYRRRRMYELASLIPGPNEELPVIGIAHKLIGNDEDIMSALKNFSYTSIKTDGMIRGWLNHILYFVLVDPYDMEVVLKTCLEKDDLHRFIQKVVGFGSIFAPVSIWRRRRKITVPAFSPKIVENFVQVFSQQSQVLKQRLEKCCNIGVFSLWPFVSTYTLDSVCETAMGVKINAQSNPASPFLTSMNSLLSLVCQRIFHLWLQPDWIYRMFPRSQDHERYCKMMHDFTDTVIKTKREELKTETNNKSEADNEYDLGNYRLKTFLDHLITLSGGSKGFTNVELREEVLTLTIAGTDTSAHAIGYTFKLLAKYPEIQEKVFDELYDIYGDSDRPLIKEDLTKMKYLERVVKESLRLFPPVPFIIRKIIEETKLPSGRVLPAGSGVVISIWGAHRDPKYWGPNAEEFDPDRFLPERLNLVHPCSYIPFSYGPRNCVGYQYALMSIKTALSTVLRSYKVIADREPSAHPRIRTKLAIMMKDVDEYEVALEKRQSPEVNIK